MALLGVLSDGIPRPASVDKRTLISEVLAALSERLQCSLQSLQRRNAVVFLERRGFGSDLRCVELDLLGIFFGLDFDEAFDWLLHGFGEIVQ